jgi:hypothetical protein
MVCVLAKIAKISKQFANMTRGSLAHGTPASINSNHCNEPVPTLENLSPLNDTRAHGQSSECFIALCRLTEILGKVLPIAYDLRHKPQRDIRKVVRAAETDLDQWEDSLPHYLNKMSDEDAIVWGSSNLHLCMLSLKMLT